MTDAWFDRIYLEDEQRELLSSMVEGQRSLPHNQQESFLLVSLGEGDVLLHPNLRERPSVRKGDLEALADEGLLRRDIGGGGDPLYDITPLGRRYYAEKKSAAPARRWRWSRRRSTRTWMQELWDAEDTTQLTRIGHACREALQSFASALAERSGVTGMPADTAKTIERIRAVLGTRALGDSRRAFLDALLAYWGTVSDLVQRQEHGAQKEGERLMCEDARRIVFQTAIVMFEIARAVG